MMMMMEQDWVVEPAWIDWRSVVMMMMMEQDWGVEPAWIDWRSVVMSSDGAGLIGWTSMNWLEGKDTLTYQRLVGVSAVVIPDITSQHGCDSAVVIPSQHGCDSNHYRVQSFLGKVSVFYFFHSPNSEWYCTRGAESESLVWCYLKNNSRHSRSPINERYWKRGAESARLWCIESLVLFLKNNSRVQTFQGKVSVFYFLALNRYCVDLLKVGVLIS